MTRLFAFLPLIIIFIALPRIQAVQAELYERAYIANPRYEFMAQQASKYMSDYFQFGQFRGYYMQTRQYDPIGDQTVERLQNLAYEVQEGIDQQEVSDALVSYRKLVWEHLANLRVVLQALALSKIDARFGNPKFFSWLRDGLVHDVMISGTGKSLDEAYDVITLSEETIIFGRLGVRRLSTQAAQEGYYDYNMHEVEDLRTGQHWTLFVNTTHPMRFLRAISNEPDQYRLSIPRQ